MSKDNKVCWQVADPEGESSIAGLFNLLGHAADTPDILPLGGLVPDRDYKIRTIPRAIRAKRFGGLINHILPIRVDPNGFLFRLIDRFHKMSDCVESYSGKGHQLMSGIALSTPFIGTYYNEHTRLLGDYDSNLYIITDPR